VAFSDRVRKYRTSIEQYDIKFADISKIELCKIRNY